MDRFSGKDFSHMKEGSGIRILIITRKKKVCFVGEEMGWNLVWWGGVGVLEVVGG